MTAGRKLEEMIQFFVNRLDRSQLTRTKLVKLLFLADQKHFDSTGDKLSNTTYIKYYYGPFSQDIIDKADELANQDRVRIKRGRGSKGKFYLYEPGSDREPVGLSLEEEEFLSDVLEEYGFRDTKNLVDEVYDEYDIDEYDKFDVIL